MIRAICGAAVGYVVIALLVIASIAMLALLAGDEFIFDDNSETVSISCSVTTLALGAAAAIIGGFIAAWISGPRASRGVSILIGIIVLFGLLQVSSETSQPPLPRVAAVRDASGSDAQQHATPPPWYGYANIAVGVAGAFAGGRLGRRRSVGDPRSSSD